MNFDNNGFGWSDSISKDSEDRVLIPEGNYNARILWVDRGEFAGSAKLSACPKAIVNLMVDVDGKPMPTSVTILLHRRLEWKIKEFFRAIGRAKQGEPYVMDWTNLNGAKLRLHIRQKTYTNRYGDEAVANEVDKFYDYDSAFFPEDDGWLQEAMEADEAEELRDDLPF